ncbi:MAG: hypothetical protein WCP55_18250, partial [Lentisphaerota bacterium]
MKKLLILSFLILGPALQSRAQEQAFTAQEQAVIDACVTNISEKVYSPAEADKCLTGLNNNNFNLLDRLQTADEPRARYILTYENAIKDLSDFFEDANGVNVINKGLIVRLERADCALCSLDMGPQPEKLMPWVSRYASDKAEQAKQASFAWDTLSPETRTFLPKDGITPETWSERYISDRMDDLRTWATAKFDEIMPPGAVRFDAEKHTPTVKAILPYLNREQRARITAAYNRITTDMKKASEQSNSPEKTATAAKYDKMQEKINKLSARPDNEQSDFLGKTFDNTTPGTGKTGPRSPAGAKTAAEASAGGAIGKAYTLTDEQAKELSPRMQKTLLGSDKEAGELSDTAVGRKAIAFYAKPENKLKFSIADLKDEHTRGAYNPAEGTVTINKDYVEKAMKQTGVTADQLMDEKNDTAIKKVTRYVAPTFVHEGLGHQGQAA